MMESQVPDSVSAIQNATNATRDVESIGQEGKIREIVMDNVDSQPMVRKVAYLLSWIYLYKVLVP